MKPACLVHTLILVPLLAMPLFAGADPVRYTVDVIGSSSDLSPSAINYRGQVVGTQTYSFADENGTNFASKRAFVWDAGQFSYAESRNIEIYGTAINDAGAAVGYTLGSASQAAILRNGGAVPILTGFGSWGMAINNHGQIAVMGDNEHAYLYSHDGTPTDIGHLGWDGRARDLNNAGAIVGAFSASSGTHAFSYADGTLHDLGTLGGDYSEAFAVNDSGMAVGESSLANGVFGFHAALFGQSGVIDLGTLGGSVSSASSINNLGQVVGYSYSTDTRLAFLFENGRMTDLNAYIDPALGWTVTGAISINDRGQILAEAEDANHSAWGILLTPDNVSPVPEPSSYAAMLVGLALLGAVRARRRTLR